MFGFSVYCFTHYISSEKILRGDYIFDQTYKKTKLLGCFVTDLVMTFSMQIRDILVNKTHYSIIHSKVVILNNTSDDINAGDIFP